MYTCPACPYRKSDSSSRLAGCRCVCFCTTQQVGVGFWTNTKCCRMLLYKCSTHASWQTPRIFHCKQGSSRQTTCVPFSLLATEQKVIKTAIPDKFWQSWELTWSIQCPLGGCQACVEVYLWACVCLRWLLHTLWCRALAPDWVGGGSLLSSHNTVSLLSLLQEGYFAERIDYFEQKIAGKLSSVSNFNWQMTFFCYLFPT